MWRKMIFLPSMIDYVPCQSSGCISPFNNKVIPMLNGRQEALRRIKQQPAVRELFLPYVERQWDFMSEAYDVIVSQELINNNWNLAHVIHVQDLQEVNLHTYIYHKDRPNVGKYTIYTWMVWDWFPIISIHFLSEDRRFTCFFHPSVLLQRWAFSILSSERWVTGLHW